LWMVHALIPWYSHRNVKVRVILSHFYFVRNVMFMILWSLIAISTSGLGYVSESNFTTLQLPFRNILTSETLYNPYNGCVIYCFSSVILHNDFCKFFVKRRPDLKILHRSIRPTYVFFFSFANASLRRFWLHSGVIYVYFFINKWACLSTLE
jgi:hypothetical protein